MTTVNNNDTPPLPLGMNSTKISPPAKQDLAAMVLLIALAAWFFRNHLSGVMTFFGNPDRLNNHLKVLKHHIDSLAIGHLSAWSDTELLGYDTFSLPYTFPNPLTYLTYWFGPDNIFVTAGFISAALLALAGIGAYAALRQFSENKFAVLVGAILYQFSTITVLKVSQNDMSFLVFVIIPLLVIAIKRIEHRRLALSYAILSCLMFTLLQFTFLQKAAYALLLAGSYALYRSWNTRDWRPAAVFGGAAITAIIPTLSRIWALEIAMSQYTRGEATREPPLLFRSDMLRWLDNTIFGRSYTDPTALANGTNLSEGFLLYASSLVPVLIILGLIKYRARWFRLATERRDDVSFFFWALVFVFAVFLFNPVLMLVYHLFLKIDFIHTRILIAGVLPIALIVSLLLADLAPVQSKEEKQRSILIAGLYGLGLAILIVWGIESVAELAKGAWRAPIGPKPYLDKAAIIRITLSTGIAIGAILLLKSRTLPPVKSQIIFIALCLVIVGQTLRAADFKIHGPHTSTGSLPFKGGDFYSAPRTELRIPTPVSVNKLHAMLQRDEYRSVIICDKQIAGGFCAAHIGEFWRLRLADGYYGMGVPKRIAALPWKTGLGMRDVSFVSATGLPWQLLGFLNVKYAVTANDALYRNVSFPLDGEWPDLARHRPDIIENPTKVVPRAFFAARVESVDAARSAASKIFTDTAVADVTQTSYAENLKISETFTTSGQISVVGGGDQLVLTFDKSDKLRFLVLNELFYPGWSARVDGRETRIYPTNVVMRGVLVPPGATSAKFFYEPFVKSSVAKLLYASGLILAVIGIIVLLLRRPREPR